MNDLDFSEAQTAITRGRQAEAELSLTLDAFSRLRAIALEAVVSSKPEEVALRERMIVTAQILDAVRDSLLLTVQGGEAALLNIDAYDKLKQ